MTAVATSDEKTKYCIKIKVVLYSKNTTFFLILFTNEVSNNVNNHSVGIFLWTQLNIGSYKYNFSLCEKNDTP
jgi:hypothetical protein